MRSLGLLSIVILVYLANGRLIGSGDTLPTRYLPFSILREFNFDLDEFTYLHDETARRIYPLWHGIPYFLRYRDGHYFSTYPPGPALLALPLYVLPVMAGMSPASTWVPRLEKLSATLITALSVLCLFWALNQLVAERWALMIACVYAFGTSSLSISSQALWQHGSSQLCLALSLYWLIRGMRENRYIPYAAFALTSSICMRPTDALIALPFGIYIAHKYRTMLMKCLLFAVPPIASFLLYNYWHFGSMRGGYDSGPLDAMSFLWQTPFPEGLSGLLFSPSRGLFIYSPIFILSLAGIFIAWTTGPQLFRYASIGPLLVVLLYSKWFMWWGGWTYGPRLLADLSPILCLFLYPLCEKMDRWRPLRASFIALALLSMGSHVLGAFWNDSRWDVLMKPDQHPAHLWQWKGSPLVFYASEAFYQVRRGLSPVATTLLNPPTSQSAPQLLAASYHLTHLAPGAIVQYDPCGSPDLSVSLTVVNDGKAVWLARAKHHEGMVQLGWRWLWQGTEVPETAGRKALSYDVFPGQSYVFMASIPPPDQPGEYILELGLVSEHITWFSSQGIDPLRISIRVIHVERPLAKPFQAVGDVPHIAITTDQGRYRQGEILRITGNLVNTDRSRFVDVYLALIGPSGQVSFWDGNKLLGGLQVPWAPLAKGIRLAKGVRLTAYPFLTLTVVGLPSGSYTSYLILTEPGTCHAIAQMQTRFILETWENAHEAE